MSIHVVAGIPITSLGPVVPTLSLSIYNIIMWNNNNNNNNITSCLWSSSISRAPADTQLYLSRIKHLFLSPVQESIVPETHV